VSSLLVTYTRSKNGKPIEMPFAGLSQVELLLDRVSDPRRGIFGFVQTIEMHWESLFIASARIGRQNLTLYICHMTFQRKEVPFCCLVNTALHIGVYSLKPSFWPRRGIFKSNTQNTKTCILSKLLHQIIESNQSLHSDNHLFMAGPNTRITNQRWRMATIFNKNCHISRSHIRFLISGLIPLHCISKVTNSCCCGGTDRCTHGRTDM